MININTGIQYIKIDITHSILKLRLPEIKYSLHEPILNIKCNLEKRFGTSSSAMTLLLKDNNGVLIGELDDENKLFGYYGPQEGYLIHCIDNDPNSITKIISEDSSVEKYVMSDEDYDKLPMNVRKFKENLKKNNPELFMKNEIKHNLYVDKNFEKEIADTYKIGDRCELKTEKHRGELCFVGQILDKGDGFFIGIRLDEPYGKNDGTFKGIKYFESIPNYGLFLRPSDVNVGDFPELDIDEF